MACSSYYGGALWGLWYLPHLPVAQEAEGATATASQACAGWGGPRGALEWLSTPCLTEEQLLLRLME